MITKTTTPFQERLNKNRDVIINHIRKIHPKCNIKVMTNKNVRGLKDGTLNRGKHFGAHLYVNDHYYYITFSRKDEFCEHYFSINTNLLELLKQCNENWHLLLISCGKVHTFDAKAIVENAQLFNETTYKIPLSAESSVTDADFRHTYSEESECIIDFKFLGNVRYSKKFDMHKKQVTIVAPEYRFRRTYSSQVEAYISLTGTRTVNGKPEGKPVSNAAYKKSYPQFLRDIRNNKLYLIADNGTSFPVSVVTESVVTNVTTSLLVENISTTNSDVVIASDVNENCNNGMAADKQPNKSKAVKKEKLAETDKLYNAIAQKLADKEQHISEQDIKKAVLNIGSNRYILEAYVEGLKEKHLHKEAVYAATLFDLLNTIKL